LNSWLINWLSRVKSVGRFATTKLAGDTLLAPQLSLATTGGQGDGIGTRRQFGWQLPPLDLMASRLSRRTQSPLAARRLPSRGSADRHQVVALQQLCVVHQQGGCDRFGLRRAATARRWLSPLISTMWQWCTRRSTAATVMELLGKISSQAVNG